jgi:elongation factor Ts
MKNEPGVMEITSEMIKKLRERTGAGMMDCKRALEASGGNMDAAVEYLRKKGAAVAEKRASRTAKEGVIVARIVPDGTRGTLVEVNCETDFVARSEEFLAFAGIIADAILVHSPSDLSSVGALPVAGGRTINDLLNDLLAKVGEKVAVRRFTVLEARDGQVSSYIHLGNKIGVLVELSGVQANQEVATLGRNLAMQVAAMNPLVISRESVTLATVERELEIYRTQAKNEGKPAQVLDRIAQGKLEKFYQEVCLMEQIFIRDSGKTVRDYVSETATKLGQPIALRGFERFQLGEELN